jgi:phage-related protein
MIPIVDSFGKGIDAISSWLTEVGKMPEVQGIVTAVGEAFGGFMKYLQDLWGFIVEQFSPVLTELMGAFKELWDALSPIGEAISEIMAAFGDAGDVDLLKIAVQAIVLEIKGLVEIIKIVVPVIKTFADAFKAAADFITPILKQVGDGIRTFLDDLKTAFQGFYNWLVGGSLWVDLWNKMLSIASNVIGQLIGALSSSLFGPLQSAFEAGISAVAALWDAGWQGVQGTFETVIGAIQTSVNTNFDAIKNYVQTSTGEYAPIATEALNGMEAAVNAGLDLIHGDWKGALDELNTMLTSFGAAAQDTIGLIFTNLEGVLTSGIAGMKSLWDGFVSGLSSAIQKIGQAFGWVANAIAGGSAQASSTTSDAMSTVTDAITGAIEGAQAVTQDGMNAVTGAFSSAFDTVSNAASGFWNWLVGGSIWPEGMDQIAQSTLAGMDVVVSVLSERLTTMMVLIEEGLTSVANSWYDTFTYLVSVTDGAMSAVVGRMQWAVNEIKRLAKELQDAMVTHSIWPDMLSEMQSQTYAALGNIVGAFNGMTLAIPATLPYTAATSSTPTAAPPTRSSEQSFAAQQSITIPITVTLDGEVIRRQVEQRIVRTVLNRGKKVA